MEEDSDENQEKHQAPENLHETSMARAFNEELKLAEIKIAFDAQNAEQVVKLPENCCMKAHVQKPTKSTNIVAVAINLFGPTSPAALAIAVGVLEASGAIFFRFLPSHPCFSRHSNT